MMLRALGLFATVACTWAMPLAAEVRAVLVGVADYKVLDADLQGPANDVRLMAETLIGRGLPASGLAVLTTDPTGLPAGVTTGPADRATILAALDRAALASASGDTLLFYFSGHGAQAPDLSGDEGGGYDEILLPADAAGWKGATQAVENAILDDELQAWAQGALDRGVKVVGLIDACHSATGFRALGGQGVARVVDAGLLGIPDDLPPVAARPGPPLTGEFVFLYSSQSDQRSFEYPLADGSAWQGEFTLRLAQVLRDAPDASWAQVLAATREAMVQGPARQMPEGEGPLLEAQVFGVGRSAARWRVENGSLQAGLLDGLAEGAEVAVYADAAGGVALAVLPLGKVTARRADLAGTLPDGAAWADLVSAPPPAPLRLAAPVRHNPQDGIDYAAWLEALPAADLDSGLDPGPNSDPDPDLVPILTEGVLALAGADGMLDPHGPGSSPRIVPLAGESPADAVARMLEQAAHGLRLRAVLAGATGRSLTGKAPVLMTIERRAAVAGCDQPAPPVAYDPSDGVLPCDQLWLTLTNAGGMAQDVSVLYFAADFAVQPIWPTQNLANRLAPGESVRIGLQIEADSPPGLEEIWVLAVPVDPDAPRVDLTRLATPQMTRAYAGAASAMALWLEDRMTGDETATRGFTLKPAPLTLLRQVVRLTLGTADPAIAMEN